jgi:hypothetical protein
MPRFAALHRMTVRAGVAAVVTLAVPAVASATTLTVGQPNPSAKGACKAPAFTTVQNAVNAAHPGYTVYLCGPGIFAGLVYINKTLVLTGDSTSSIQPSLSLSQPTPLLPPQFAADNLFVRSRW